MILKKFVGVFFENSWQVIPKKWILVDKSGTKAYWPEEGDVEKLARTNVPPTRKTWGLWNIEIAETNGE